jgi:uncharacterized coiled-coil DUF342 family protein
MSRHRDYQPTIDRAYSQIEIAQRREAKLREKKDECHREMLRAQNAARIANEEADALRDRITGLEQSVRDLRGDNAKLSRELKSERDFIHTMRLEAEARAKPWWDGMREWFRDMLRIGAEA